ncbi:MAG: hypothetical protein LBI53_00375 [Candidatus Peribacteria bacterium]|jgi:hypothetical protein|nr:hypothetical protein [Candidatus Peribacteria bacterium]
MKILMCCATPKELKTVKTEIKNLNLKTQLPIEYLCTGIGNHLTIFRLTRYLEVHQREKFFVVNVGVCGYSSKILPYIQCVMVEHIQIQKEHIIPIFLKFAPLKKLVSSDVVVDDE